MLVDRKRAMPYPNVKYRKQKTHAEVTKKKKSNAHSTYHIPSSNSTTGSTILLLPLLKLFLPLPTNPP